MKKKHYIYKLLLLILIFPLYTSCNKGDEGIHASKITGFVQKGPFINGSSITIYDLKNDLTPTGKSYNTTIVNNQGSFEIDDVSLSSNYVSLRADGFYYNEVTGNQSTAQITLYALADIRNKENVNVNLLTHLEKPRVEYLMEQGISFAEAKVQAQKEIFAIFNIENANVRNSEELNITSNGEDDGILLAISAILQGYRTESQLTELLANIGTDITEDGVLNNTSLGTQLINHALFLDSASISNNLKSRYQELGLSPDIPAFEKYIKNFIAKTSFVSTGSAINYPATGLYGENILDFSKTSFLSGINNWYSLSAILPASSSVKIKISLIQNGTGKSSVSDINHKGVYLPYNTYADSTSTDPGDSTSNNPGTTVPLWYYYLNSSQNWMISDIDLVNYCQTFTSTLPGGTSDLRLFFDSGSFLIEYYEMGSSTPTKQKTITVQ